MKKLKIRQIFQILLAVGITVLILRTFLIDSFRVKGDSMAPTILTGDYIFIDKISYRFKDPAREHIIVAKSRPPSDNRLIKRIIGLPGERIEIAEGRIRIKNSRKDEGKILSEPYLTLAITPAIGLNVIKLDPKEYFVLGDNRYFSIDSRELGPIDEWDIEGRVFFIFRPKSFSMKFL